ANGPILTEFAIEGYVGFPPKNSWASTQLTLKTYGSFFYGGAFQYVLFLSLFMLVLVGGLGVRRKAADKFLLTSIAVFIPFYLFVFLTPQVPYLAYLFPLLYLAVSSFVCDSIGSITRSTSTTAMLSKGGLVGVGMLMILLGFAMGKGTAGIREALRH